MMLLLMSWVSTDQVKMIMSRLKCDYQVGACEEGGFCWCFTNIQFDCWLQCWLGLRSFHHAACHLQLQPPGLVVYLAEGRAESNSDCQLWLRMTDGAIDGHCSLIIAEKWLTFINYIFITTLNDEFPQIPRDKVAWGCWPPNGQEISMLGHFVLA